MGFLARFIGVDRYADSTIRDLAGARRDATALWALFADTLPDLGARLLVDKEATAATIRGALNDTLASADRDDTVLLSFSGHGTRDHRLVAHDTHAGELGSTTISMGELAAGFKASRARRIVLILDCCFAGGAPARVLDDSPIARDPGDPLLQLAGEGRLLIAAADVDESAYELPRTRHGLLTTALIDVLTAADFDGDLQAAASRMMDQVRADAARLGVVQTPVVLGHVTGGLRLPTLVRGERYAAAFPSRTTARVEHDVAELAAFAIPETILGAWAQRLPDGMNDLQRDAVNKGRVLDGASLLVVAPTSAGKTFIGEMAAVRAVLEGRKAVFLLPYRALVNEKYEQFSSMYGDELGLRVVRCLGDRVDQVGEFARGKFDLAVLTFEMFLSLAVRNQPLLHQLGLVVLDEAQFITDPMRGITVELILTYLIAARERDIHPQMVALSAVIGDLNGFDQWLGGSRLTSDRRPVPLIEGVLDRRGRFQHIDENGHYQVDQFLDPGRIQVRRRKPGAQDVLVPLVSDLVEAGEKVIVFRNRRGHAAGCAGYLADELRLRPATQALEALPQSDPSQTSVALRRALAGGTALHTADLTREEREIVEREFRRPDGPVRAMAATTTLAAGINTPASTVILAEHEFLGEDGRPFTVAEYKNMAGRAGRLGFRERGKAIILAETPGHATQLFIRYVQGRPEPIRSSFDPADLETWVMRLIAQVPRAVHRSDVSRLLANTYGGYLAARGDPDWRGRIAPQVNALVERMLSLELLSEDIADAVLQLTLLGRACAQSSLSLRSALQLVSLLRSAGPEPMTALALLALVQTLAELDATYTPLMKGGTREQQCTSQAAHRYGYDIVERLRNGARDMHGYLARCKRAAVLHDWIDGAPIEQIEHDYSPNLYQGTISHGDIRRFADATRIHLRSAAEITAVLFPGRGPDVQQVDALLRQLETGLPAEALRLLGLPLELARGEYLALHAAGASHPDAVWALAHDELQGLVGTQRADALDRRRPIEPS